MESVGNRLRQSRLELTLTLEQVSQATRISSRNLLAIESDNVKSFSSPFLYRSFVKQYAACLSVSDESILALAQATSLEIAAPLVPGEEEAPLPKRRTWDMVRRKDQLRWLRSAAVLTLSLVACCSVYGFWKQSRQEVLAATNGSSRPSAAPSPVRVSEKVPAPNERVSAPAEPTVDAAVAAATQDARPVSAPTPEAAQATPPLPAPALHLELFGVEPTLVSVEADGKAIFRGILSPLQTKVYEAHDLARVRVANAGGVAVTFNGKLLGLAGDHGQAMTLVFDRNGYQSVAENSQVASTALAPTVE